jgi:Flp pilus assembly protein TadB
MEPERQTLEAAQLEKLQLEIKKLQTDLNAKLSQQLAVWVPVISSIIAVGGLLLGINTYFSNQEADRNRQMDAQEAEQRARDTARDMDARRSLWEKQLTLYFEASNAAATIATTTDEESRKKAIENFWRLYWGPLAIVEDKAILKAKDAYVEHQMVQFGQALDKNVPKQELQRESLKLATTIAESIDLVWSTAEAMNKSTYKSASK